MLQVMECEPAVRGDQVSKRCFTDDFFRKFCFFASPLPNRCASTVTTSDGFTAISMAARRCIFLWVKCYWKVQGVPCRQLRTKRVFSVPRWRFSSHQAWRHHRQEESCIVVGHSREHLWPLNSWTTTGNTNVTKFTESWSFIICSGVQEDRFWWHAAVWSSILPLAELQVAWRSNLTTSSVLALSSWVKSCKLSGKSSIFNPARGWCGRVS